MTNHYCKYLQMNPHFLMTKWCTVVSFLMLWKVWILDHGELRCLCQEPGNRMDLLPGRCCCDADLYADEPWWDLPFLSILDIRNCHFWHLATCHTGHLLSPINPGTLRPTGEKRLWRDWAICSFALSQSFHGLGWMWGMLSKSSGNGGMLCPVVINAIFNVNPYPEPTVKTPYSPLPSMPGMGSVNPWGMECHDCQQFREGHGRPVETCFLVMTVGTGESHSRPRCQNWTKKGAFCSDSVQWQGVLLLVSEENSKSSQCIENRSPKWDCCSMYLGGWPHCVHLHQFWWDVRDACHRWSPGKGSGLLWTLHMKWGGVQRGLPITDASGCAASIIVESWSVEFPETSMSPAELTDYDRRLRGKRPSQEELRSTSTWKDAKPVFSGTFGFATSCGGSKPVMSGVSKKCSQVPGDPVPRVARILCREK